MYFKYLSEITEKQMWPKEVAARAMARVATAEIHAGFVSLRTELPFNVRLRTDSHTLAEGI